MALNVVLGVTLVEGVAVALTRDGPLLLTLDDMVRQYGRDRADDVLLSGVDLS